MAINLEGYDSTTGKKVPVTVSDTVNISLPSSSLEVPVFTGNLAGKNTVEEALQELDTLVISQGATSTINTFEVFDDFIAGSLQSSNSYISSGLNYVIGSLSASTGGSFTHSNDTFYANNFNTITDALGMLRFAVLNQNNTNADYRHIYIPIVVYSGHSASIEFEIRFKHTTLPSSKLRIGLMSSFVTSEAQLIANTFDDFIGLRYVSTVDTRVAYYKNNVLTAHTVLSPLDTNWHIFRVTWNAQTGATTYYMDGVSVGTTTTSFDANTPIFPACMFESTTDGVSVITYVDWIKLKVQNSLVR